MNDDSIADLIEIVDDGLKLAIGMKPRKRRDLVIFLGVWLAAWMLLGALSVKPFLISGHYPWWLAAVWFAALAGCVGSSGLTLLYYLAGRDVVIAEPGRITVREEFRGVGISRKYGVKDIEILELEDRAALRIRGLSDREIDDNSLWFEHGGKIFPVGSGLKLEQAERLRRRIASRLGSGGRRAIEE